MKPLIFVTLCILTFSSPVSAEIKTEGEVTPSLLKDISKEFRTGAQIYIDGHLFKVLPPQSEGRIYKVVNTDKIFTVYFSATEEEVKQKGVGYHSVKAKYICTQIPCALHLFSYEVVYY